MNTTIFAWVTFVYLASFVVFLASEVSHRPAWGRAGKIIAMTGLVFHTIGIAMRWAESYHAGIGHAPLSNFYESLVFFSWSVCMLYLIYARKETKGLMGVFVMPAAFLLMAYASFSPGVDSRIQPLIPALKSNWLIIHVVTCFLGYAAFFLASSFGVVFLMSKGTGEIKDSLANMLEKTLKAGFILFTFGIVTGSVWAHFAWGRYWGWDPKETWALITWFIYAAAIHVRIQDGTVSRRVAIMMILGLVSVLFTYFGVNYLPGLHSYQ
jgi:ABC-type transport system involved in cytochrome c biogenesis permease subunit